jgi:hypothetical protein
MRKIFNFISFSLIILASLSMSSSYAQAQEKHKIYAKVSEYRKVLAYMKSEYEIFTTHLSKKDIYLVSGIQVSQNTSVAKEMDMFYIHLNEALKHLKNAEDSLRH